MKTKAEKQEPYRSKLGPIDPEAFDNDPVLDDNVDTRPGSLYDKMTRELNDREKPKPSASRVQPGR